MITADIELAAIMQVGKQWGGEGRVIRRCSVKIADTVLVVEVVRVEFLVIVFIGDDLRPYSPLV